MSASPAHVSRKVGQPNAATRRRLTFGMVGTYPPTECGLATFAAALRHGMSTDDGLPCQMVRLVDEPVGDGGPEVLAELRRGSPASIAEAADALNRLDATIVQHEYGIYGGDDGEEVLEIVERLNGPTIVVLHTVLDDPTPNQRRIIESLATSADALVTMTRTAQRRLREYDLDMAKVSVIPHGAHPPAPDVEVDLDAEPVRPTVLTWGLLGPGKGIEWVVEAMALLTDLDVPPLYQVVGKTHPKVLEQHGEAYRSALQDRADELGVSELVEFVDSYSDRADLQRRIAAAHVVVLPYDSEDQVTSGVLIEAVASSKAVISSSFPHAVELLGGGVGLLVPRQDPEAIAAALRRVLTEPSLHERMVSGAAALAPSLSWTAVGAQYRSLADALVTRRATAVA
ncbi:MAG: glycosyltransferase [Acidimicrobiales bacterium]